MGLFSRRRVVGVMRLDFLSPTEVVVTDQVPNATHEVPYLLWFAFLYAGKLLANFPPPSGQHVVNKALSILGSRVDPQHPLADNDTMLGVCCERPLAIVASGQTGRWVYSGELFSKGNNLLVNTAIARGDEDHFHRAAIDVVFEVIRRRLGDKGGAVPSGALGYFAVLAKYGCDNLPRNLQFAASAAMTAAASTGRPP